jgi:hypothetical protein
MANQPLDSAFAGREENRKKSSRRIVVIGALFVGLAGTAASVYAANVNINSQTDILFAQGVEDVVSCDTDGATTDISSTFSAANNYFAVDKVTISNLSDACIGLTLDVYITDGTYNLGHERTVVVDGATNVNTTEVSGWEANASAVTDVALEIRG